MEMGSVNNTSRGYTVPSSFVEFDFLKTDSYAVFYNALLVEKGHFKPGTASSTQELVLKFKSSHFLRTTKSDYLQRLKILCLLVKTRYISLMWMATEQNV